MRRTSRANAACQGPAQASAAPARHPARTVEVLSTWASLSLKARVGGSGRFRFAAHAAARLRLAAQTAAERIRHFGRDLLQAVLVETALIGGSFERLAGGCRGLPELSADALRCVPNLLADRPQGLLLHPGTGKCRCKRRPRSEAGHRHDQRLFLKHPRREVLGLRRSLTRHFRRFFVYGPGGSRGSFGCLRSKARNLVRS